MKIKKGLENECDKHRSINSRDAYSCQVLCATMYFGQVLDAGNTPKEAEKFLYGLGLSISQANFVMQNIWHFHPRGEEIKRWWNKQHGYPEDAKDIVVSNMFTIPVEVRKKNE
jgi:hypothetical protein